MSHFSSLATKITNKDTLLSVLRKQPEIISVVDSAVDAGNAFIVGYNQNQEQVDIACTLHGTSFGLGFNWNPGEGVYEARGDFSMAACSTPGQPTESDALNKLWMRIVANYVADEAYKSGQVSKDSVNVIIH